MWESRDSSAPPLSSNKAKNLLVISLVADINFGTFTRYAHLNIGKILDCRCQSSFNLSIVALKNIFALILMIPIKSATRYSEVSASLLESN